MPKETLEMAFQVSEEEILPEKIEVRCGELRIRSLPPDGTMEIMVDGREVTGVISFNLTKAVGEPCRLVLHKILRIP